MSLEYDFKSVKKELSKSSALDQMKKDVLAVLPHNIWEQNVERCLSQSYFNLGETENHYNVQREGQRLPQRQDCKWEDMARSLLNIEEIPESKKNIIYKKWEQRMNGNFKR